MYTGFLPFSLIDGIEFDGSDVAGGEKTSPLNACV